MTLIVLGSTGQRVQGLPLGQDFSMLFSELDRGMGLPGRNHEGAVFPSPHLTNRTRCSCWPWSPSSCTARLSALLTGGCCAATAFYFLHIVCVSCFTPPFLEITPSGCGPWARGSPEGAASGWLLSGRLLCNQWIRSPLPGGGILFLLTVSSECRGFSAGPSASLTSGWSCNHFRECYSCRL